MEKLKTTISIEDFYKSDMTLMSLPNDEPLFTLIQKNNKLYTMFLLQERTLIKKKQLLYITEILVTEPKITDLSDLIDSKTTVFEFLSKSKNFKIRKINDLTFQNQTLDNVTSIENKLPKKDTYLQLDKEYKNKIINYIQNTIRTTYKWKLINKH